MAISRHCGKRGSPRAAIPPDFTAYCPKANVTREEMASFLARAAGLGGNPPVANAQTAASAQQADQAQHAMIAEHATTADTATTLGGREANDLVRLAGVHSEQGNALTADFTALLTVTVQAPGRGYILVNGVLTAFHSAGMGAANGCTVYMRLAHTAVGAFSQRMAADSFEFDQALHLANTFVFPIVADAPQTFTLEARNLDAGSCSISAVQRALTALYVPFGSNGLSTLPQLP
jgi:hypothetical protein